MHRIRRLALAAVLLPAICLAAPARATAPQDGAGWVASWSTALQAIPQRPNLPSLYRAPDVAGRTVRQVIYPTLGGSAIRLHISNRYGRTPLDILSTRVAQSASGGAALREAGVALTFNGKTALHLPPGGEADSDPAAIAVLAGTPYAVSFYLGPDQQLQAWHRIASRVNYVSSAGDHSAELSDQAYRTRFTQFAWITSLSVAHPAAGAILAIGDSITDGLRSSLNTNHRWPDLLARRLAESGNQQTAVLNAGISGNRLLSDSPCYGERLLARFDRELAAATGTHTAILLIGINDINFAIMPPRTGLDCDEPHTQVTAADIIAGYRQVLAMAHRRHVRLLIGTITPADLAPAQEKTRLAVNAWIRVDKEVDGVVDFDAALRDPARPQSLRKAYDSGDHVHPSDAGYGAMAAAVPLPQLGSAALSSQ